MSPDEVRIRLLRAAAALEEEAQDVPGDVGSLLTDLSLSLRRVATLRRVV